jgi:hypothetical protein
MKYNLGDKVIYNKKSARKYAWQLIEYNEYTIISSAFSNDDDDNYYCVKSGNGTESCWYLEEDFMINSEYRKIKLKKINENTLHK